MDERDYELQEIFAEEEYQRRVKAVIAQIEEEDRLAEENKPL